MTKTTSPLLWDYNKFLTATTSAFFTFIAPIAIHLACLFALILIDLYFGIKKHLRENNIPTKDFFSHINSFGLRRTIAKSTDYLLTISAVAFFEFPLKNLNISFLQFAPLTQYTIVLLSLVELKSLDENFKAIYSKSILSALLSFLFHKK